MKRELSLISLVAALAVGIPVPPVLAESFTYQGKLENAGSPFTGTVTIRLGLYAASTGGSALRTQTLSGVTVNAGIFSVTPASFLPGDFPGAARYLNIEVSADGVAFTPLTPRQEVTWSPMAMHAKVAESVSGAVPAGQITGALPASQIAGGTVTTTLNFSPPPAAGAPFTVGSAGKVVNLNTDLFDGLDSGAFLQKTGGTLSGTLNIAANTTVDFGSQARQMLNLWGAQYGLGVQAYTLYQRSNDDFSWFRGGAHDDDRNSPGSGGTEAMRLIGASSTLWLRPATSLTPRGRLVFGDLNTANGNPYVSIGEAQDDDDTLDITAEKIRIFSNSSTPANITFSQSTGQSLTLFQNAVDSYGIGVQANTEYFRTGEQFAWYKDGLHSDTANSPGPGGSTLMTLSGTGTLTTRGSLNGFNLINRNNTAQEWALYSRNSGGVGQFAIWNNGTGDVAAFSPNGDLYLVGQVSASVLTVRGGADVAEPFEMTEPDGMAPGTVVIIDEENPGKLKLSTECYDNKVAGIISGAGGVKPGLRLHQEGVMDGDHHVALSGRVYVKADASSGKIRPGDLLTTSSTPGHAMKVKDHDKAQGAILGKAMSRLDSGTGLVLVLVTLQ